jgi:hypothetical protein
MTGDRWHRDHAVVTSPDTPAAFPQPLLRISAVAAPTLLLLYGVLRLVDGLDGSHGPGLAWDLGHALFLAAFVFFGCLVVGLRGVARAGSRRTRVTADSAAILGGVGVCCFLWVILGDLFPRMAESTSLPDPLYVAGPVLFQLGATVLLVQLAAARPRRLPVWSPALVFVGFVLIAVDLDLLPVGALLILFGLAPLARRPRIAPGPSTVASR